MRCPRAGCWCWPCWAPATGTLVSHQSLLGPSAGVTLLVVMTALKTLELRARRDATVVFYLGFFLVLVNFLHSQSLVTALAMGVSVWLLMTALRAGPPGSGRWPARRCRTRWASPHACC